ncbi:MAG: RNA polymerase factor sigma-54 [Lachnospiraceae bacterium]|nr:RNA polymerase factor sigma-54 [Lachnospiraceae bacterium]
MNWGKREQKMDLYSGLKIEQKTVLSMEQQQSLEILALNNVELEQRLQKEFEENPFLEYTGGNGYEHNIKNAASMEYLIDGYADKSTENIRDELAAQLDWKRYTDCHRRIIHYLLDCLDDRGYLENNPEEIAGILQVEPSDVLLCLCDLRELEPAGIFSCTIEECLKKQLEKLGIENQVIYRLIDNCLPDIAAQKYTKAAKAMQISEREIRKCEEIIKKLNPFPLGGRGVDATMFLIPDLLLSREDESWKIEVNDTGIQGYGISDYYVEMLRKNTDPAVQEYLQEKLRRARLLMQNCERRRQTLVRIVETLADLQQDFFIGKGKLRPMKMRDISSRIHIHESTVSRAIAGKYLQFPCGTILMKELFSGKSGVDCHSADGIKRVIQEMIAGENRKKPLSDSQIAAKLGGQEIRISRRGVAKYREELGIPGSFDRKDG